ncbi:MAG TPA: DUF4157 domain-containing protein [Pyrinomonadaceae bacterium]
MREYVRKQDQAREANSIDPARPERLLPGPNMDADAILQLQHSVGNQAVLRMLQSERRDPLRAGTPAGLHEQESAHDAAQADCAREVASEGISGAAGTLPHLDAIQKSFGRHDVSGVAAHTGAQATAANEALGASGYAMENHVAFAEPPDLHTAAHEAAHVVQQRSGVQLQGEMGQVGDQYEKHADAVAEQVVQGRSSEHLLDAYARSAGPSDRETGGKGTILQSRPDAGGKERLTNDAGRNAFNLPRKLQLQSKEAGDKGADKKAEKKDDDKIKKIRARIEQVFDMDYFVKVWSVYNPDRSTLSEAQEMSLNSWLTWPEHAGWQKSYLIDEFYKFLGYYFTTFRANPKYNPKSAKQDEELLKLQMYLDEKKPKYMELWNKYDRKHLTSEQEAFLKELKSAGFPAENFFRLLEGGLYH